MKDLPEIHEVIKMAAADDILASLIGEALDKKAIMIILMNELGVEIGQAVLVNDDDPSEGLREKLLIGKLSALIKENMQRLMDEAVGQG